MSGIPNSRKMWITPLSPVHMGTNEDYTPTSYVIDDNALFEFDQTALEYLPATERKSLDRLLSGKASQEMLKSVQSFFHNNKEWLIPASINIVRVSDELVALYQTRMGKAANIESDGKEVYNRLEIERAAYNPFNRRLFFPGSGIKGAMRTALLDAINNGNPLPDNLKDSGSRDGSGISSRANREFQKVLFKGEFSDDPMCLVQVGDCSWNGLNDLNCAEVFFAVNRKKHPVVKGGKLVRSMAENGPVQMLECAAPFHFRAYQGLLNISDLTGIKNINGNLPKIHFSFDEIAASCNRFYNPIFDAEIALLKQRGYLDSHWREGVQTLLSDPDFRKRIDNNEAFLLRVGRHSGAESITLNGVRKIKIMKGKAQKPSWEWEKESKTIWLATGDRNDQRFLCPFGWVLVELTELNELPPAWSLGEKQLINATIAMGDWLAKVKEKQKHLQNKVHELQIQAEQKARIEAERVAEEVRIAAEKVARLAELSPLEREIEAIFEKECNNNPGAILFNMLQEGIWEAKEDQRTVAQKIKSQWEFEGRWIPYFSGSNKQKTKQKLRCEKVLVVLGIK